MKKIYSIALALIASAVLTFSSMPTAHADSIGYVDFDKIVNGYNKAVSVLSDIKVREAEIRKMQADFVKQVEMSHKNSPKNPVSANQLEKELNQKLQAKVQEYRDWATIQQKSIDQALENTIKEVAQAKSIDVVLTRNAVFNGGTDLTNEVLAKLNAAD